ncbi:MAG TPA: hypothetical protein VGI79_22735 [Caulobacteraceae bacterium]|jgi:hypothetical protein
MASSAIHPSTTEPELKLHAASYHHFMLGVKWVVFTLGAFITFATLWFATPAGFLGGAVGGALVFAVGAYAMNHGLAHSTESDNPT